MGRQDRGPRADPPPSSISSSLPQGGGCDLAIQKGGPGAPPSPLVRTSYVHE